MNPERSRRTAHFLEGIEGKKMRLERIEGAEISANRQFVVRDEFGEIAVARHFGGRTSNSGATVWPEWVEEGATAIKPLACITESDLTEEGVVCFSGGGLQFGVRIYRATSAAIKDELEKWRRWRRFEPSEPVQPESMGYTDSPMPKRKRPFTNKEDRRFENEPIVSTDSGWIARAISYHEALNTEGTRVTEHEVSRHATEIVVKLDPEAGRVRWTASMKRGLLVATALEYLGRPEAWKICRQEWKICRQEWEPQADFEDFIEADDPADEPMPKPFEEVEDI
jgi:hypothetical protein